MEESKHDKFVRISEGRVEKAVKAIELLVPLGNRKNYDYTDDEADEIFNALDDALDTAAAAFGMGGKEEPQPDREPEIDPEPNAAEGPDPDAVHDAPGPVETYPSYGSWQWSKVAWALEVLQRGDAEEAVLHLRTALGAHHAGE